MLSCLMCGRREMTGGWRGGVIDEMLRLHGSPTFFESFASFFGGITLQLKSYAMENRRDFLRFEEGFKSVWQCWSCRGTCDQARLRNFPNRNDS